MATFIKVKDFDKQQHYKDRNPLWIKLYNNLLESYEYSQLSDSSKGHLLGVMLLASRCNNKIPNDPVWISQKTSSKSKVNIKELIDFGFLEEFHDGTQELDNSQDCASKLLAHQEEYSSSCDSLEEKRREEKREETTLSGKEPDGKVSRSFKEEAKEVLSFLNEKTGRSFEAVEANIELIVARLKEPGVTVERCRSIIAKKYRDWHQDDKMAVYLRPATLFNRSKFWQYEGELIKRQPTEGVENEETVSRMQKDVLW